MISSMAMIKPINQMPLTGHLINKITPKAMEAMADIKNQAEPGDLFNLNHKMVLDIPINMNAQARKAVINVEAMTGS